MFQLKAEIHAWCQSMHAKGFRRGASMDELEDHLRCEIDRLLQQGMSEEQAFLGATKQVGGADDLVAEYSKNRGFVSRLTTCPEVREDQEGVMTPRKQALFMIGYSLILAGAILASALLLGEDYSEWMIILWLPSLWLLPGTRQASKAECAYFRQLFRSRKQG